MRLSSPIYESGPILWRRLKHRRAGTACQERALRCREAVMRVAPAHPSDLPLKHLATALSELCAREGLDPCQTACVIIESLAWTPRLPRKRKRLPRVSGHDRSKEPMAERTEMIRQRAHEIWQAEGQPDGRALEHWCRAEAEIARRQPAETRPRDPSGRTHKLLILSS